MRVVILLISFFALTKAGTLNSAMSTIVPSPHLQCMKPILDVAEDMIHNAVTVENFHILCTKYEQAVTCFAESTNSSTKDDGMEAAFSGLEYACETEKGYFDHFLSCLEGYQKAKNVSKGCETECGMMDSLVVYTNTMVDGLKRDGTDPLALLPQLDGVCSSTSCFIKCVRKDLNEYCGTGGSRVAEAILRPFKEMTKKLKVSSPQILRDLTNGDNSCAPLFIPEKVNEMVFEDEFMEKVQMLAATRMAQELHSNRTILDSLAREEELLRHRPGYIYERPVVEWTSFNLAYVCFIAAVMVATVVGLAFFVGRCARDEFLQRRISRQNQEDAAAQTEAHIDGTKQWVKFHFGTDDQHADGFDTSEEVLSTIPEEDEQMTNSTDSDRYPDLV